MRILRLCIPHSIERMDETPIINNMYFLIGIAGIVLLILGCAYVYSIVIQPEENPIETELISPSQTTNVETIQENDTETNETNKDTQLPTKSVSSPASETWCFVGEDLSGRYCVKVPSDSACPSSRSFRTRIECELVSGSHMPAGITRDGVSFRPLQSMKIDDSRKS